MFPLTLQEVSTDVNTQFCTLFVWLPTLQALQRSRSLKEAKQPRVLDAEGR